MNNNTALPLLYSFRRCPYAMRARLALSLSGMDVICREIDLKNKAATFLETSPKGTVPVLVLTDGTVIDESLDIVDFACKATELDVPQSNQADYSALLQRLSSQFIPALNRLKYTDRYENVDIPAQQQTVRQFCDQLNTQLKQQPYLYSEKMGKADMVLLPFIRQLSLADPSLLNLWQLPYVAEWLQQFTDSRLFQHIMQPWPVWQPDQAAVTLTAITNTVTD